MWKNEKHEYRGYEPKEKRKSESMQSSINSQDWLWLFWLALPHTRRTTRN